MSLFCGHFVRPQAGRNMWDEPQRSGQNDAVLQFERDVETLQLFLIRSKTAAVAYEISSLLSDANPI